MAHRARNQDMQLADHVENQQVLMRKRALAPRSTRVNSNNSVSRPQRHDENTQKKDA